MAVLQRVEMIRSAVKVLSLWNGSTNIAPPTDWEDVSFDDSGWASSSVPATDVDDVDPVYGHDQYGMTLPPPGESPTETGGELVAPWVNIPHASAKFLVCWLFDVDAVPTDSIRFIWEGGGEVGFLVSQHSVNGSTLSPMTNPNNLESQEDDFVAGTTNLMAFLCQPSTAAPPTTSGNWGGTTASLGAALEFHGGPDGTGGYVWSWGTIEPAENDLGVLGVGDDDTHLTPTTVLSPGNVRKVSSNGRTTLFLTTAGTVYGMGDNTDAMALADGSGDSSSHLSPVLVTALGADNMDIAVGGDACLAIKRSGAVVSWGHNVFGSVGDGSTSPQLTPFFLTSIHGYTMCSAGKNHSIVAGPYSGLVSGGNSKGQLGNNSTTDVSSWSGTFFGGSSTSTPICIAAGDEQSMAQINHPSDNAQRGAFGTGKSVYGSLGSDHYTAGAGADKIVDEWAKISGITGNAALTNRRMQVGPVAFLDTPGDLVAVQGFGDPYGGVGDDGRSAGQQYGIPGATAEIGIVLLEYPEFTFFEPDLLLEAGGLVNPVDTITGDSWACFGGIVAGALYTWGYGGYGQMGNGGTTATNLAPVSINGLTEVIGGCVAERVMFAISTSDVVLPAIPSGWVAVIG